MPSTCALQQALPLLSPLLLHKFPSLCCTFLLLFYNERKYSLHLLLIFWSVPKSHWLQFSATLTPLIALSVDPCSFPPSLLDHVSHNPKKQRDIPVRQVRNSNNHDIEDKEISSNASEMVVQLWTQGNTHSSKPKPTSKHHKNIVFAHFDDEPSLQTKPNQTSHSIELCFVLFCFVWGFGSCWMLSNIGLTLKVRQYNTVN